MSKRALVKQVFYGTRSSYWFLPTVIAIGAIVAAQVTLYLDNHKSSAFYFWPEAWAATQVDGARATLSVISQSVLGVVGVMFSVTIVAVSYASGNFGPRLIGNFMRDRGTQWSMGILIGTFVFTLLTLRAVQTATANDGLSPEAFVPHLSLGVSLLLMGVSIMTVIYYLHHIPEIINVSNISAGLGHRLRSAIETMIDKHDSQPDMAEFVRPDRPADIKLALGQTGYIQTWDKEFLVEKADEKSLTIEVLHSAGYFVSPMTHVMHIWTKEPLKAEEKEALCGCFVVGQTPTEAQNLLFTVQQLVEMIARALSPGINDPYTAINCLNWLYVGLSSASMYNGGLRAMSQKQVSVPSVTFESIFDAAIVRSLPFVETDKLAMIHMLELLNRLKDEIEHSDDQQIIRNFLRNQDAPALVPEAH